MSPESGNDLMMMDSDPCPASLETLLREYLETVSKNAPKLPAPGTRPSDNRQNNLIDGLGQYLCLVAQACSELTDGLVLSPHLDKLVVKAHEESRQESRLTDISEIVNIDIEVTKLNNIRSLTEKFSRDVQNIWNASSK